jgi:pSer/pThr/pTyr-binding forkhead associated (FHA) protein
VFVLSVAAVMRRDLRPPRQRAGSQPKPAKQSRQTRRSARTLVVTAGPLAGTNLSLTDETITLGRSPDNTLVLDDDYVSSHHACLRPYENRWLVEDLNSTNGTYLDGHKVLGPTVVPNAVPVKVGKTVLELRK